MLHLVGNVYSYSLTQAFDVFSNFNYEKFIESKSTAEAMVCVGLDPSKDPIMDWEDIFHYAIVQYLEPYLPDDAMVFLYNYPSRVRTLAKTITDEGTSYSDRWELYIAGVETANCFNEETDPDIIFNFMQEQENFGGSP